MSTKPGGGVNKSEQKEEQKRAEPPESAVTVEPAKQLSEEEQGKQKVPLADIRKGIFALHPGMQQPTAIVDGFMMALQHFVYDLTMINKGTVALPPVDRGSDNLLLSYDMPKGKDLKEKGSHLVDGKLYHVHSTRMSKGLHFNFCGVVTRIPHAGALKIAEAFGVTFYLIPGRFGLPTTTDTVASKSPPRPISQHTANWQPWGPGGGEHFSQTGKPINHQIYRIFCARPISRLAHWVVSGSGGIQGSSVFVTWSRYPSHRDQKKYV